MPRERRIARSGQLDSVLRMRIQLKANPERVNNFSAGEIRTYKQFNAPVAQLDRVPGYEPGGRRFDSFRARQIKKTGPCDRFFLFIVLEKFEPLTTESIKWFVPSGAMVSVGDFHLALG